MAIKYRVKLSIILEGDHWEHWDKVSFVENPGWLTCWNLDSLGANVSEPTMYYPNERIVEVLRYKTGSSDGM